MNNNLAEELMTNEPDLTRKDRRQGSKEKVQRSEPTAMLYDKYTNCREKGKKHFLFVNGVGVCNKAERSSPLIGRDWVHGAFIS